MDQNEINKLNQERLHLPNLTCAFDILKDDTGQSWTLNIRNHEKGSIRPKQLCEVLWQYANEWTKKLMEFDRFNIKENETIPDTQVIIQQNQLGTMYAVIFAAESELNESHFAILMGEFCKQFASLNQMNLQGVNNDKQS